LIGERNRLGTVSGSPLSCAVRTGGFVGEALVGGEDYVTYQDFNHDEDSGIFDLAAAGAGD
jgi:hypothetical protein